MDDEASKLVIEIARSLVVSLNDHMPGWSRGYLRLEASDSHYGCRGSCVVPSGVQLLDDGQLLKHAGALGAKLRTVLAQSGPPFCVALLTVNSDLSYKIDLESRNSQKWQITKMGGASGIPAGVADA